MARARLRTIQHSLSSGEFSPEFDSRLDVERYYKGASLIKNFTIRQIGGARRRLGTRYVASAKDPAHRCQLVSFVPRANLGYVLEFSDQAIRFFRNNGQIQQSPELIVNGTFDTSLTGWITTPMTVWEAGTAKVTTTLSASLRQDAVVTPDAVYVLTYKITGTLPIGALLTVGSTVGSGNLLSESLTVGTFTRLLSSATGLMSIKFHDPTHNDYFVDDVSLKTVSALEVASPYLAADLARLRWAQSADVLYLACEGYAPRKLSRTSDTSWVLSTINFRPPPTEEKPVELTADITLGALTGTGVTLHASAAVFLAGDDSRIIKAGVGRAVVSSFTDADDLVVDILDDFTSLTFSAGDWTIEGTPAANLTPSKKEPVGALVTLTTGATNTFRSTDVGKYVHVHNGIVKLTKFTSALSVSGEILAVLEAVTATTNWSLESESWNATDGWPVDVGFSQEDRLVWVRDDRAWGSVIADYESMGETTLDDAAFSFGLRGSAEVPNARGIIGANELQLFSSAAEFTMTGGSDDPITPTNIRVKSDTNEGSARVRPIRVNGVTLFVNKSGRGVMEFVFSYEPNRFVAPNLSLLSPHFFPQGTQIVELGFQRTPDSTVWVVRSDGLLLALAYQREQNVVGWTQHLSEDGAAAVESLAVIPHPDGDREQVWLCVRRTVNGATVRYIEFLDDSSLFSALEYKMRVVNGRAVMGLGTEQVSYGQANLDACVLYNGPATSTFTGLGHLEGKAVRVVADGAPLPGTFTVTGAAISIAPRQASKAEIGLMYDSILVPVRPEIQVDGSTIQGVKKRVARAFVRLYQTLGLKVNGQAVNFRLATDDPALPPPLYSGDIPRGHAGGLMNLGWDRDGRLVIEQTEPLPCTVTMISTLMGVGG